MYTTCKDSLINTDKSPLTQKSLTFSKISFLLNSIPEPIVILSENGIIVEINSATSRLFGWTKDEIINRKNISFLLTNRDGEKLMNIINNEELSSIIDSSYHFHGLNKNGLTFPCNISFGIFPKSLLDNYTSSDDLLNNSIIAAISTIKKGYRLSDSVLLDLKSRYQNEYDEIETLGKGGFGQVFKARNRLDGQLYAIKKIKLQSKPKEFSSSFDLHAFDNLKSFNSNNTSSTTTSNLSFLSAEDLRIVREVKTFARISNHPNIVRYHASWIEVEEKVKKNKKKKGSYDDSESDCNSSSDDDDDNDDDDDDDDDDENANETDETDDEESDLGDIENKKKLVNFNDISNIQQNLDENNDLSYSNTSSISHNVNFHSHDNSIGEENENNSNNQNTTNEFIISFADTGNSGSRNNSNEYLINMEDIDSIQSSNSNIDDTTNINSSDETSYNIFSFREDNSVSYHVQKSVDQSDKILSKNRKKGKNRLDPINTSVLKPMEKKNNLMLYLIIQMELCSGQTLETWIQERNQFSEKKEIHVDRKVIFKIFKQIVQAIAHVHWNGCIHRDVKPANVFLQDDNHILLGDFGLAKDVDLNVSSPKTETIPYSTTLVDNDNDDVSEISSETKEIKNGETKIATSQALKQHKLTSGVGTYIYASPEQLASSQGYDNKTDIYSLGILLFELLWPFKTGMERIKTLTNIRNGKFPDNFVEKWPLELPFLRSLLNPDPALRPTAQEILDSEVLNINYITPLYNNPTDLLNALDLRVTRISLDPNESVILDNVPSKERRKGHNKTLSSASKSIKNYGDCGACKQKDMAISSFRSQFIKTKEQITFLEDSVAKASKRIWVVSIVTFILGCTLTMGITLLIITRNSGFFSASSIDNSRSSAINTKNILNNNNNNNNFDMAALISEDANVERNHDSSIVNSSIANNPLAFDIDGSNDKVTNTNDEIESFDSSIKNNYSRNIIENVEKTNLSNKMLKRNNRKINERIKERRNLYNRKNYDNIVMDSREIVMTQTLSINYFYKSRTITVTRTKTKAVHFDSVSSTNTQTKNNSTPTIKKQ